MLYGDIDIFYYLLLRSYRLYQLVVELLRVQIVQTYPAQAVDFRKAAPDLVRGAVVGTDRQPVSRLSGTIAMEQRDNYSIDFNINCAGRGSFSSEEIELEQEPLGSTGCFLTEFQPIELNKEIPLAIVVYDSGTSMRSYTPQDYYEVSLFEGMDLVQAVTVRFTDREIGE